jgi:hypothetical protein
MFRNPSWIRSSNENTPTTDQAFPKQRDTDRHRQTDITQNYYGSKIHSNTTMDRNKTITKLDWLRGNDQQKLETKEISRKTTCRYWNENLLNLNQ